MSVPAPFPPTEDAPNFPQYPKEGFPTIVHPPIETHPSNASTAARTNVQHPAASSPAIPMHDAVRSCPVVPTEGLCPPCPDEDAKKYGPPVHVPIFERDVPHP